MNFVDEVIIIIGKMYYNEYNNLRIILNNITLLTIITGLVFYYEEYKFKLSVTVLTL